MKTGIIGGTFDPIHYGHLLLAETARDLLNLDRVIFVPAGIPPHKQNRHISAGADRAAMIRSAIEGVKEFEISLFELETEGISYTVRTLRHFHEIWKGDTFFLIVGSETLRDIPGWYQPEEICRLASFAPAHRAGAVPPSFEGFLPLASPDRIEEYRKQIIPMPLIELSSTAIRERIRNGKSIRFMTPGKVADYIYEKKLYWD